MIGTFLKRLALFLLFLMMQVLVFNHVQILGYATPMICVYLILLLPLDVARWQVLLWGFAIGLVEDIFTNTPGMSAASLTLVALVQPRLLKMFTSRDLEDDDAVLPPSARTMSWAPFLRYVAAAVFIQEVTFYLVEAFSFFNFVELLINIFGGTLMTFLIIVAMEGVRMGGSKTHVK